MLVMICFMSESKTKIPGYNKKSTDSGTESQMQKADVPWHGKKCAIVLTYDDALNVHLDNAIPLLDSVGLKGTFFINGASVVLRNRMDEWKEAAANGHELGNHTLFHPCDATLPGREWVSAEQDLSKYTVKRMVDEIRLNNLLLKAIDGKNTRTFAFTCGDTKAGGEPFFDSLVTEFPGARGVRSGMHKYNEVDLYNIDSYMINGESSGKLVELVRKAMETNSLLVFLFHGVGGEHSLNVSLDAHRELVRFLKQNEDKIWTTTLVDVAEHIRSLKQ
jgi:sialate O-acetylesterase